MIHWLLATHGNRVRLQADTREFRWREDCGRYGANSTVGEELQTASATVWPSGLRRCQSAIPKGRGFEPHSCHFLPSGPSKIRSRRPDSNLKAHIEKNKCIRRKTHRKDCYETIISLVIWGAYGHLADVISFVMRGLLIRLCIPGAARPHILHCPPPRLQNWPCFV